MNAQQSSSRPKDAATLILVNHCDNQPVVLLGKRSTGHVFMPDKYVFPGGRVEPADGRVPSVSELRPHCKVLLQYRSRRKARALALAAVRETFEETGLIAGAAGKTDRRIPVGWEHYFSKGAIPDLVNLKFIGRAITPPGRTRRFDARFFLANASEVLMGDTDATDSSELLDLQWVPVKEAMTLDVPTITRMMLEEVLLRLSEPRQSFAPPFVRQTRNGFTRDRMDTGSTINSPG